MKTDILKLEEKAKKIISGSNIPVWYFGMDHMNPFWKKTPEVKENLLKDIHQECKNILSIYNQNSDLTHKNIILRSIIINMFNYNFWGESKILPNSTTLLKNIYNEFNSNKSLDLFFGNKEERSKFIEKLKLAVIDKDFKCEEQYLKDINKLSFILRHHKNKLYKIIDGVNYRNISIKKFIRKLAIKWPSYGKDKFFKREILAWYFIKDIIPNNLLKKDKNEDLYFPIDYRLPTLLNHMNFMQFPKSFNKYFQKTILKDRKIEEVIRATTLLTLINLNRWLEIDAYKLDFYFFSKSRKLLKEKHLRFYTTDY
jgi:hypothetical protein